MGLSRDARETRRFQIAKAVAGGASVDLVARKFNVSKPLVYQACREYKDKTGEEVKPPKPQKEKYVKGSFPLTLTLSIPCLRVEHWKGDGVWHNIDWTQRLEHVYHACQDVGIKVLARLFGEFEEGRPEATSASVDEDVLARYQEELDKLEALEQKQATTGG